MVKTAKVSVCMAVYNGEKFIRAQVESVLNQLQATDELLIFDDVSTDSTAQIITEFKFDQRVKFVQNINQAGVIKNFERALSAATGEYIFLCDQDDIWLPGKVAECVTALQTNLLVVTDCIVVNEALKEIVPSFFELRNSGDGFLKNIWRNSYLGCCMAFRQELLISCLPIPASVPMHDMWIGLIAEARGNVKFIPQKLLLYRRHGANASPTAGKSKYTVYKKIQYRIKLLRLLIARIVAIWFYR